MDLKSKEPKGFVCLGGQKVSLNQKKRTKLSENKDFWRSSLKVQILACVQRLNGKGGNLPKFPTAVAFKGVPACWWERCRLFYDKSHYYNVTARTNYPATLFLVLPLPNVNEGPVIKSAAQ